MHDFLSGVDRMLDGSDAVGPTALGKCGLVLMICAEKHALCQSDSNAELASELRAADSATGRDRSA